MSIASWKVRAGLPVALVLAWAGLTAHGDDGGTNNPPIITSITAVQVAGQKFRISGTVTDENPAGCVVAFSGAANQSVTCDASGSFSGVFDVPTPGQATAVAGDGVQSSQPVTINLTNAAPTTTCQAGARGTSLVITGHVTDEVPAGLVVTLSGSRAVNGRTAIVLADGSWSLTVTVLSGVHGTVTATVTDWYGLTGQGSSPY
jgi:hypothetical protein